MICIRVKYLWNFIKQKPILENQQTTIYDRKEFGIRSLPNWQIGNNSKSLISKYLEQRFQSMRDFHEAIQQAQSVLLIIDKEVIVAGDLAALSRAFLAT